MKLNNVIKLKKCNVLLNLSSSSLTLNKINFFVRKSVFTFDNEINWEHMHAPARNEIEILHE